MLGVSVLLLTLASIYDYGNCCWRFSQSFGRDRDKLISPSLTCVGPLAKGISYSNVLSPLLDTALPLPLHTPSLYLL